MLLTPYSNACIEGVFSLADKNKSEGSNHNRLDIKGSLSLILTVKLDCPESVLSCVDYDSDDELLQAAKKKMLNCNKQVTGQSFYLGCFFYEKVLKGR